jgi:hypothetical protein
MSSEEAADQVKLRVEFSGLCLYMIHDPDIDAAKPTVRNRGTAKKFAVLMPDARKSRDPMHEDDTRGEAHVGYVRFDLANLDLDTGVEPAVVEDDVGRPRNEIVHRLDREVLDFGIGEEQLPVEYDLAIPSFNKFADRLTPIANLLAGSNPDPSLLMRTHLSNGEIHATGSGKIWAVSSRLNRSPNGGHTNQFGGYAVWTRPIDRDQLTVTIKKFDGTPTATIPLRARRVRSLDGKEQNMITVKISNLCAHNPLEWRDYPTRTAGGKDVDFKWLYRLLEPTSGLTYPALLNGHEFPVPEQIGEQGFGDEDCTGGSFTH